METLAELAQRRLGELKKGPNEAAIEVGLNKDFIGDIIRGRKKTVRGENANKLARALQVPVTEIVAVEQTDLVAEAVEDAATARAVMAPVRPPRGPDLPRDLPVLGTAAGSAIGAFQLTTDVIDYVRRPPALSGVKNAYAVYVVGESMAPRFEPGELVFVHPHRPVQVGDSVIIQVRLQRDGEIEAFVKRYQKRAADKIVVEQFNPRATVEYKLSTVVALHKVVSNNELYGV